MLNISLSNLWSVSRSITIAYPLPSISDWQPRWACEEIAHNLSASGYGKMAIPYWDIDGIGTIGLMVVLAYLV